MEITAAPCSWEKHHKAWPTPLLRDSEYTAKKFTATAGVWGCPEIVSYNEADIVLDVFIFWTEQTVPHAVGRRDKLMIKKTFQPLTSLLPVR